MRLPIIPTLIVLIAVGIMIALGIWQLQRAEWKNGLLERYDEAESAPPVAFPTGADYERFLFRRSQLNCLEVLETGAISGRNQAGASGYAMTASCDVGMRDPVTIRLGWTSGVPDFAWQGGPVSGWITTGQNRASLIADPVPAELADRLQPLRPPDPSNIPNNHLAYAGQWFFFAFTALLIYIIALRRRMTSSA